MRFETPFINLLVSNSEFLKMVENLEYYMGISPVYAGEEMDVSGTFHFPVGRLDDVRLYFNHYETFEEACQKWEHRKKRINWDNLFIEMCSCDLAEVERFDMLPYENKICFVPFNCEYGSAVNIEMYGDEIEGDILYSLRKSANKIARNGIAHYDVLKLLNGKKDFLRVVNQK